MQRRGDVDQPAAIDGIAEGILRWRRHRAERVARMRQVETDRSDIGCRRLLGVEGDFGQKIGLSNDWAFNIISMVGNYGEIYERNVGRDSPLKIERGLNRLWTQGGLHYAPPID